MLLAEDQPDLRELLAEVLRADGYGVVAVPDGASLLRVLDEGGSGAPSLVVTDVHLPGLWGLDSVALARELIPAVPVVVITAFGSDELRAQAGRVGARAVLDKPFELGQLLGLARRLAPRSSLSDARPADWPYLHELEAGPGGAP